MKDHLKNYIESSKTASVRGLRILLEYFYALEICQPTLSSKLKIVSVFGSARCHPEDKEYKDAKKLGTALFKNGYAVVTGASMGIMQAANEGVSEGIIASLRKKKSKNVAAIVKSQAYKRLLKKYSVGLKVSLPFEPASNPFVGVYATFHYFMVRKFFFGTLSSAFIACEGGWGTRDELFEMLTLVQTGKAPLMPIIYITKEPAHLRNDLNYVIKKKYISTEDRYLLEIVPDYKKAVASINRFYSVVDSVSYEKAKMIEIRLKRPLTTRQKKVLQRFAHKELSGVISGLVFSQKKILLKDFTYSSFGYVRRLINSLS